MITKMSARDRALQTFNSGAVGRLNLRPTWENRIICYQRISWEISLATALGNTRCRLVIVGLGYDLPVAEQQVPVADTLYWIHDPVWLREREQLVLLIDQPQDGTIAEMHGIGYWVEGKEGVV